MIFSEFYSAYYNAVAEIISRMIDGETSERELQSSVEKKAFSESVLTILPALKSGRWQLCSPDMTTALEHKPTMPLTLLEKRWLKAISLDPRIALFDVTFEGLEDIEPLFTPEDYLIYDKYSDGDPYLDEGYIARFRTILSAIKERHPLRVTMVNRVGQEVNMKVMPERLEYSEKDDKFRLICSGYRFGGTINLGRMTECRRYFGERVDFAELEKKEMKSLTLTVTDERNALERVMLHFAHFEKQAEKLDGKHYRLKLKYDGDDETELVIRILSFGPLVKVDEPQHFVELIKERLEKQMHFNLR